jgi:branched-chain amino acid transport system substrate-binding protein
MTRSILKRVVIVAALVICALPALAKDAKPTIVIGLDADFSSGSARAGEAIRRGAILAVEEINSQGGVLGRQLELMALDHRGNPARGKDNIETLATHPNTVAVLSGLHTPVALYELDAIHQHGLIFLVPWAAGTSIVSNGRDPNFVFRVSVRDEFAGAYLVGKALEKGYRKPALLLEQTGWGRSNHKAMTLALAKQGIRPVATEWFLWGVKDLTRTVESLRAKEADVILFVGNAPEGGALVRSLSGSGKPALPVISHWGITGGRFFTENREILGKIDLRFLQTHSFLLPNTSLESQSLADDYIARFSDARSKRDIFAPAGTAHTHDLVHLLARAIELAGTTDRARVRDALERIDFHAGVVTTYSPPFTKERHDALDARSFRLARFDKDGTIIPEPSND